MRRILAPRNQPLLQSVQQQRKHTHQMKTNPPRSQLQLHRRPYARTRREVTVTDHPCDPQHLPRRQLPRLLLKFPRRLIQVTRRNRSLGQSQRRRLRLESSIGCLKTAIKNDTLHKTQNKNDK
eukprot:PhF_6_TR10026/c0_g1_i1/m.15359